MKKYFTFLLITFILFKTISCSDKECDCDPKAHLGIGETCSCGTGCTCTEQTAVIAGTSIPIRKQSGVTVAQMNSAVEKINDTYNMFSTGQKAVFPTKVIEIRITIGKNINHDGKIIIFGLEALDWELADYIMDNLW